MINEEFFNQVQTDSPTHMMLLRVDWNGFTGRVSVTVTERVMVKFKVRVRVGARVS